jgi:hypothetical protein
LCLGLISGGRQLPPFSNAIDDGQFAKMLATANPIDISHSMNSSIFYIIGVIVVIVIVLKLLGLF